MTAVSPMEPAAALLSRLEWTVLRRLDGALQGGHRTLAHGSGLDLADLRPYEPQDDVRHIDWNVTARLDQPHVRQFTEDRDLTAWFLLDLTGSVDVGGPRSKRAVSIEFTAAMARLFLRGGDRVGAVLYGTGAGTLTVAPGTGRRHLLQLLHRLQAATPRPAAAGAETRLDELLHAAGRTLTRRAAVFVVSDFHSAPGWERALGRLAQRHEVLAVRLLDRLERALPDVGVVDFEDAETGETLRLDTGDPGLRARYAAAAQARDGVLRSAFAASGVDTLELSTDDDLVDVLLRHAELRRLRRRAAAGAASGAVARRPSSLVAA